MSFKLNLQALEGESYTRCHQVLVDNRLDEVPRITFAQERIASAGGQVLHMPLPPAVMDFDPAGVIPLLDPETGAPTGASVTQAEAYALLYSAYAAAASPAPGEIEEE